MLKQSILFLALLLSFTSIAQKEAKEIKQFVKELDQKIPQLLTDFSVPGTAIAIIENGEVILQKGYGYANVDKKTKVTTTTGFNIGSISKTIAAWGIMKLVQEGKINLDAPANTYLTRWQLPASKFDANKVTIRRLLSHTAGLSLHGYPGWSPKDTLPTIEESLDGKNNGPGRVEMIMEPGTKWKYSGGGFTMLQLILEEVTGQKFEAYMQAEILNPLGMKHSSYTIDDTILKDSSLEYNNFGARIDFELFTAQAAAGLHTNIEDFTKFALASLYADKKNSKNQQILAAATLEEMMEPAAASNGMYGLGYQVDAIPGISMPLRGHGGANAGWHALFMINPITNDGIIMMTNGGAGQTVYRQLFCDWIFWKTGESLGDPCNVVPSIANKIKQLVDANGINNIAEAYIDLKKNKADAYNFSENQLNELGYHYLGNGNAKTAAAIFKLNVDAFPNSSNVYDSYGEALLANGNKEKAIKNYLKAVELNPASKEGVKILEDLGVATEGLSKELIVAETILQTYVGSYALTPEFIITITKNGNQLKAQATGQGEFEIYPKSDTVFYLKVVEAQVTFNSNATGEVVSMTLLQGGQEKTGLKVKE